MRCYTQYSLLTQSDICDSLLSVLTNKQRDILIYRKGSIASRNMWAMQW